MYLIDYVSAIFLFTKMKKNCLKIFIVCFLYTIYIHYEKVINFCLKWEKNNLVRRIVRDTEVTNVTCLLIFLT